MRRKMKRRRWRKKIGIERNGKMRQKRVNTKKTMMVMTTMTTKENNKEKGKMEKR